MEQKRHKPEEIVAKLRQVEVLTGQGRSIAEAARSIGVSEQTYFRWRAEYGGMKVDQLKRLKSLKMFATEAAQKVIDRAVQIFGGKGVQSGGQG
jgi:putative transposase